MRSSRQVLLMTAHFGLVCLSVETLAHQIFKVYVSHGNNEFPEDKDTRKREVTVLLNFIKCRVAAEIF